MANDSTQSDRRKFLGDSIRVAGAVAGGAVLGVLAGSRSSTANTRWQIDPDECMGCGKCAANCVLDVSAVKCVQCFDMCGYCDICTGYFDASYTNLDTAAENQLCPTGAVVRKLIEKKAGQDFFEYTIEEADCIGCAKCVKGVRFMNGSLYLQVMHDRCLNCNECSIAVACPTEAFRRIPADTPYMMKRSALALLKAKAEDPSNRSAQALIRQVVDR